MSSSNDSAMFTPDPNCDDATLVTRKEESQPDAEHSGDKNEFDIETQYLSGEEEEPKKFALGNQDFASRLSFQIKSRIKSKYKSDDRVKSMDFLCKIPGDGLEDIWKQIHYEGWVKFTDVLSIDAEEAAFVESVMKVLSTPLINQKLNLQIFNAHKKDQERFYIDDAKATELGDLKPQILKQFQEIRASIKRGADQFVERLAQNSILSHDIRPCTDRGVGLLYSKPSPDSKPQMWHCDRPYNFNSWSLQTAADDLKLSCFVGMTNFPVSLDLIPGSHLYVRDLVLKWSHEDEMKKGADVPSVISNEKKRIREHLQEFKKYYSVKKHSKKLIKNVDYKRGDLVFIREDLIHRGVAHFNENQPNIRAFTKYGFGKVETEKNTTLMLPEFVDIVSEITKEQNVYSTIHDHTDKRVDEDLPWNNLSESL